ncbi:O-fucosyltransferase family protein [Melia azedarach]|uniref:O-fucosyltransferase family protein n=1 Tax=Melia azedarach TaxID=155640 RepID=A0ACC1X4Q8_MELAZ|nr:O-fucosyltransferase family protein [Melia azedarach]
MSSNHLLVESDKEYDASHRSSASSLLSASLIAPSSRQSWPRRVPSRFLSNGFDKEKYSMSRNVKRKGGKICLQDHGEKNKSFSNSSSVSVPISVKGRGRYGVYGRMLALAAHALVEGQNKREPKDLWQEPVVSAFAWRPCANQRNWEPSGGNNGYILVTANGGMNQQRVAICNDFVLARLLNATLVVPKFMYSSVWKDVR